MKHWFTKSPKYNSSSSLPAYRRRQRFMRGHEISLYRALVKAAGREFSVLPKVKLFSLVEPQQPGSDRDSQLHWIRGHQQLVDFVLCTRSDMEPALAIRQLTTAQDLRRPMQGPDLLDTVLSDIGLPVLRVRMRNDYSPEQLRKRVNLMLGRNTARAADRAPDLDSVA